MEETKKSNNLGFLFALLKILGIIVGVVALVLIAVFIYVRVFLGIDIFGIINIVKKMGADFDESTVLTAPVTETDTQEAFAQFDIAGLTGFYSVEDGEYIIKDDISSLPTATCDISLSDKQTCALVQTLINSTLQLEDDMSLDLEIKQIKFSNFTAMANGAKVDVNMVFYTSLKELKAVVNVFPVSLFIKYIPDDAYVSVNFTIEQTGDLTYEITPKSIVLNSLTADQTARVIAVVGGVLGDVTAYSLCGDIGDIVFQALIGNDNGPGLVKELNVVGIEAFAFELVEQDIKFSLKI